MHRLNCILFFIFGAGVFYDFRIHSMRLNAFELIAFFGLPILFLLSKDKRIGKSAYIYVTLNLLYVVAVTYSDYSNNTFFLLYMRGVAKPLFLLAMFIVFYLIIKNMPKMLVPLMYGFAFGSIIYLIRPQDTGDYRIEEVKYSYYVFVVLPIVYGLCLGLGGLLYKRYPYGAALIWILYSIAAFLSGARSASLIGVAILFLLFFAVYSHRNGRSKLRLDAPKIIGIGLFCLLPILVVYLSYIYAAPRGYLGAYQAAKYEAQSRTPFGVSPIGFFISGRSTVVALVYKIRDRPIVGLGSWSYNPYILEVAMLTNDSDAINRIRSSGMQERGEGHSVFLGAWANAGVLAAIYWIYVIYIVLRSMLSAIRLDTRITPFLIPISVALCWSWCFSPLGPMDRIMFPLVLAVWCGFYSKDVNFDSKSRLYKEFTS